MPIKAGGEDYNLARIVSGTYSGDGTLDKKITTPFRPRWIRIDAQVGAGGGVTYPCIWYEAIGANLSLRQDSATNDEWRLFIDQIISVDDDGFHVDDGGTDAHPNKNGQDYYYVVFG